MHGRRYSDASNTMNPFSVLDDSDDEAPPVKPKAAAVGGGGAKKSASTSNVRPEMSNMSIYGTNASGKEKKQNKNRKTQPKTDKSSNNQRRSDSDANTKKVSKSGGGSRNWGNEGDEARRADKDEGYDGANNDAEDDAEDEEESETEPVTFTLDEYMAQKASKKKDEKLFGAVKERAVDSKVEGKKVIDSEIDNYLVVGGLKENKLAKEKKERNAFACVK